MVFLSTHCIHRFDAAVQLKRLGMSPDGTEGFGAEETTYVSIPDRHLTLLTMAFLQIEEKESSDLSRWPRALAFSQKSLSLKILIRLSIKNISFFVFKFLFICSVER